MNWITQLSGQMDRVLRRIVGDENEIILGFLKGVVLIVLPMTLLLVLVMLLSSLFSTNGDVNYASSSVAKAPTETTLIEGNPWTLISQAEKEISNGNPDRVADILSIIIQDFPQSLEAKTVIGLIRRSRRTRGNDAPWQGEILECTRRDAKQMQAAMEAMQDIIVQYQSNSEKQRALADEIFGHEMFSDPELTLERLLDGSRRVQAAVANAE